MTARYKEGYTIERKVSIYFLVCKGLTIDDVGEGVEEHRISGKIRPGAGFETADFVKETLGGLL